MTNSVIDVTGMGRGPIPLLPSAARTASPNTIELQGTGRITAMTLVVDVTALTATGTLTVAIVGVDRPSGKTWPIVSTTAGGVVAVSTTVLKVAPGITAATSTSMISVADILPPDVRVVVTAGNGVSITYSVTAHLTN